jgi:hypothetical protein
VEASRLLVLMAAPFLSAAASALVLTHTVVCFHCASSCHSRPGTQVIFTVNGELLWR